MEIKNHSFRVNFRRDGHYLVVSPYEMSYQRNGVFGEGFFVLRLYSVEYWENKISDVDQDLFAVVFDYDEWREDSKKFRNPSVAIVDYEDLDRHFRGDNYAQGLYETIHIFRDDLWK